jgi:DNA-binding GntR family transcriptional regulator
MQFVATAAILETLPTIERRTLGDAAYLHLRELLMSGRVGPGERLSLRSLAAALGVSMMPVREAVTRLVADRALEVTPNRAVRVPVMTATQFREMATIRVQIEGFAAECAAKSATAGQLEVIAAAEIAFRTEGQKKKPDLSRAVALNKDFHFAVYEASGLPDLVEIIGGLWLKIGPIINLDLRENPERLETGGAVRFHAECTAAIQRRDGAAARAAIAADISGTAAFLLAKGGLAEG